MPNYGNFENSIMQLLNRHDVITFEQQFSMCAVFTLINNVFGLLVFEKNAKERNFVLLKRTQNVNFLKKNEVTIPRLPPKATELI